MTSMIKSDGNLLGFFERPIAAVLGVITLAIWAWVIVGWARRCVARPHRLLGRRKRRLTYRRFRSTPRPWRTELAASPDCG